MCSSLLPFLACILTSPTFQGSHVIAMVLLMFAPGWWKDHFKPVINPMPLADIRNPENLDPPPLFGPNIKRGRGDQLESDSDESEVIFSSRLSLPTNSQYFGLISNCNSFYSSVMMRCSSILAVEKSDQTKRFSSIMKSEGSVKEVKQPMMMPGMMTGTCRTKRTMMTAPSLIQLLKCPTPMWLLK